ncbi:hypothetical protein SAMD00019534_082950 [Acytostelium subglobosum LB1]|uniref:hypothetical protein n=1 Tax=Acytostelium subglobosum LB1 TaxID=1410327 RepID=UPI00064489D6|nr:hypothetical protein SAMD00019534_082950 [Acytostelium subglobosum LB1]GAM25120.1 hypothetical protein SAMD00019534_082950 [Acytostelium subglobosum LB1]|eukprot:XP_012752209.1 hypothetical protein SAMD00019534_082950 [Acytostelium subglobosum LB1]
MQDEYCYCKHKGCHTALIPHRHLFYFEENIYCTSCGNDVGNEVSGKLPNGGSIYTLDRKYVAVTAAAINDNFAKTFKWQQISELYKTNIRHLNGESPEFSGRVFVPTELRPGQYRDTQFSKKVNMDALATRNVTPRKYQLEALTEAMARDIILVLPTGMGKTLVSVMLMQQMIAINQPEHDNQMKRMVLFLVTTLPLVKQQTLAIKKHNATLKVMEVSSESEQAYTRADFESRDKCPDVVVMTQGAFFNIIKSVSLAAFHLIIFDEAHNATGRHAYARVMTDYYEMIPHNLRPKILGLTASPSIGKSEAEIGRNIDKLEFVLKAKAYRPPSLRDDPELDSDKLIYRQTDAEKRCQEAFIEVLNDQLRAMQQRAKYISERLAYRGFNATSFETELRRFMFFVDNNEDKIKLDTGVGDIIRIFEQFNNVHVEGYLAFVKYLRDDLKSKHNTNANYRQFIGLLLARLEAEGAAEIEKSSKYLKLVEQLDQCTQSDQALQKFRGIIFVKTRATSKALLRILKKEAVNARLNIKKVVGHSREDGMDSEKQTKVMDKFASGQTKLIVATSVIEEGIDVQGCNFVMCFENDFNIRSLIQRRGRARSKADGSFLCLMNQDEDEYLDDILNMERILNHIIKVRMVEYMSHQQEEADEVWRTHFETNKHQPHGERKNIVVNVYNSDIDFDRVLRDKLDKNIVFNQLIISTQESRRYLKRHKEYVIGLESNHDSINYLIESLYATKGWWAKINPPAYLNIPTIEVEANLPEAGVETEAQDQLVDPNNNNDQSMNHSNQSIDDAPIVKGRKPPSEAFDLYFSCGNFTNPTTFVVTKEIGQADLSYEPDERMLEVNWADCKFQFKKENFDSFCLYDCDPIDKQYQSLYLIVKRPPIVIVSGYDKNGRENVAERQDRRHHPFLENSFVYRFQLNQFQVDPLVTALNIPYFMASINDISIYHQPASKHLLASSSQEPVAITHNAHLCYLFAVLRSNKYTGFGKTVVPQAIFDRMAKEFADGNMYAVNYLVDHALELQEFESYDSLVRMDLSLLPKLSPIDIPMNHVMIKSAYVTPSRVVFNPPRIQLGNRCVRLYDSDRFMTVQFTEEDLQFRMVDYQDLLVEYYRDVLTHGIRVTGFGVFYYLGNSSSQARSYMSWFYCVEDGADVDATLRDIRQSLIGEDSTFESARKALRCISLVFPATTPTIPVDPKDYHEGVADILHKAPDGIEHNFTEGVGYIGQYTARRVCEEGNYPESTTAFQIRIGGNKGVLSVHPTIKEGVYMRKSMRKFPSNPDQIHDRIIEVISVSGPKTCYLNRQVIVLLSGLGVPDGYFIELQQRALTKLANMFHDQKVSKEILSGLSWLDNALDEVDLAVNDPLIGSALQCCYMKKLDKIQDKCFIPIESARTLMGISDESSQLKANQVFVQISNPDGTKKVIEGKILVCKNPCLHPGDVRVLEAVDVPELQHVYLDVIAFSQHGDVPNFKQCSGSDLDGDRYFVCFDTEMVNYVTEFEAYLGENLPPAPEEKYQGTRKELVEQYLANITKGALGKIALSHMALCDKLSPKDPLCINLAKQHFIEVDAVKTGIHGKVPEEVTGPDLLDNFTQYPHFMESQMPRKTYWESKKVLGTLFQGASVLKAVPQFIPDTYVDESRLVEGYTQYMDDAKVNYQRYKNQVKSLLNQYDIEKEEDILVEFIKETINSFRYHQLLVDEIRMNYQRIHQLFKDEFLREFPGRELEEKLRGSNDAIERKVAAWYHVSHSDVETDHALSFYWIVKCFQAKRQLKKGHEKPDYLSQSIIEFVEENQLPLMRGYSERIQMINDMMLLFRREGGVQFSNSNVLLFGSSSLMLFDPSQSDLDLYLRNIAGTQTGQGSEDVPEDHDPALKQIEVMLKSSRSFAESIEYCQNTEDKAKVGEVANNMRIHTSAENVEYVKNTAVPIVRFQLNKLDCDISVDSNGIRKTAMMCNIFDSNPMIFQVLYVVIRWGRETGLLIKQMNQTKSRNLKTWSLIWMVIEFFREKKKIDLSKINLDEPNDNKSVEWWSELLDRSPSPDLGYYLIKFFKHYSKRFARVLRQKDKGDHIRLMCPLDSERVPSLDINPSMEDEHCTYTVFLQEIFTIAHHTLASSGRIEVFLKRCLYEKKKIINLDKMVSRHIRGNEAYIETKIATECLVKITIYPARRGCLQVKISGEPANIQQAMDQFHSISSDMTNIPLHNVKKHVVGGGTVLLYKSSKSINDTLSLVKVCKERMKATNIQHSLKNPKMQGVLKSNEDDDDLFVHHAGTDDMDPQLQNAKLEYQKVIWQQMEMCRRYDDEKRYGKKMCFVRLGHIYLFNCPYESAEMTIDELQKAIAKSRKRNLNLEERNFDLDACEDEEEMRVRRKKVTTSMRKIERSNNDELDEGRKKNKTKLPKSSFYTHMAQYNADQIHKMFEARGWRRDINHKRLAKAKEEEFILCCKGNDTNVPEFKVAVRSDLQPPHVIKNQGVNWFVCDLTTNLAPRPDAQHLDVRFCIQSKRELQKESNSLNEYESKDIAKRRENNADGRLAPIEISKEFLSNIFLIRHHFNVVVYHPPARHPMSKYNLTLSVHTIKEYRNTGDLYAEKIELEMRCDMPSSHDTLAFTEQFWKLGLETVNMFNAAKQTV